MVGRIIQSLGAFILPKIGRAKNPQQYSALPSKQTDFSGNIYKTSDEALNAARIYFQENYGPVDSAAVLPGESNRLPGDDSGLYVIGQQQRIDVRLKGQTGGGYQIGEIRQSEV